MSEYKTIQTKRDPNVPHILLEIWEDRIPIDRPLSLSQTRKATLNLLFVNVFSSRLASWEEFVDLIARSEVLMLKASKARNSGKSVAFLDWAIKPETCLTILEGIYTDRGKEPAADLADCSANVTKP